MPAPSTPAAQADYLLATLRCARLRVLLLANEIDEIGVALKHGMVSPPAALEWLRSVEGDRFLFVPKEGGGQ